MSNKMASVLSLLLLLSAMVLLSGCASRAVSDKVTCEQKDWYEIGRHDGAQGLPLQTLNKHRDECGKEFSSNFETVYTNGRNAGLVEYCAQDNARELGRMGVTYHYVCPSTTEPEFLASYRKGQAARRVEIENQKLDAEIDVLLSKLNKPTTNSYQKRQIASELDSLRKTREQNDKALAKTAEAK